MPVGPAPMMITGTKSGSDAGAPLDCAFMRMTTLLRWVPRSMAPSSVATVASTTSP